MSLPTCKAARRIVFQRPARVAACASCRFASTQSLPEGDSDPASSSFMPGIFDDSKLVRPTPPELYMFHHVTRLHAFDAEHLYKAMADIDRVVAKAEQLRNSVNKRPTRIQINKKIPAYKYAYVSKEKPSPEHNNYVSVCNKIFDRLAQGAAEMTRHLKEQLAEPYKGEQQKTKEAVETYTRDLKETAPEKRLREMINKQAGNARTTFMKAQALIGKLERLSQQKEAAKFAEEDPPELDEVQLAAAQEAADAFAKRMLDQRQQSEQQDRDRANTDYAKAVDAKQQAAEQEQQEEETFQDYDDFSLTGSDLSPGWGAVAPRQAVPAGPARRVVLPMRTVKKVPLARTTLRPAQHKVASSAPTSPVVPLLKRSVAPPLAAKWQKASVRQPAVAEPVVNSKPIVRTIQQNTPVVRPARLSRKLAAQDAATRSESPASILGLQEAILGIPPGASTGKPQPDAKPQSRPLSLRDRMKIMEEETMQD